MKLKAKLKPYLFIIPIAILLLSFYVLPIIMSLVLSFTNYKGFNSFDFISIKNYQQLFRDSFFITALKNTFFYALIIVPVQTILALVFAELIHKNSASFSARLLKTILFIPVISSMVLVSVVWRTLLNGDMSPLNQFFHFFGLSVDWLSPQMAKYTIILISIWKNVGYFMIIYLAGLMQIPSSYYEAAKMDGATDFEEFRYITLPLLKPTTILVVFLSSIWSLQIFDLVYMLTGGGPANATSSLVMRIYEIAFKEYNVGYAMSVANVLLLITAIITIAQRKLIKKESAEL